MLILQQEPPWTKFHSRPSQATTATTIYYYYYSTASKTKLHT